MAAHREIETLKESVFDLKSECNSAKADLAMEKLHGDGKANKALAEACAHAEYLQKFMSRNTPGSGSRSQNY